MTKSQQILKSNVLKLYYSGVKPSDIVAQTGVSRSTMYYWLKNSIADETPPLNLRDYHFLKQKCERQEKMIEILKSAPCTATSPLHNRLKAIEEMVCDEYNVNILCETLNVAKGTYYNHILRNKRGDTKAARRRRELLPVIEEIYHESNQIYGAGKVAAIMKERGYNISEGTVAQIMHDNNLFSIRGGAKKLYDINKERRHNILKQNFNTSAPNEVWVSDVTYLQYKDKRYYLCVVLDLYARKIVSWSISQNNTTHLTKKTLKIAVEDRKPAPGLIFHSDNGPNFISYRFRCYLKENNIKQSLSRYHTPYDNSVCESFFKNFKQEEFYRKDYRSEKHMFASISAYMDFYNENRPHSNNFDRSPNKYEENYYKRKAVQ